MAHKHHHHDHMTYGTDTDQFEAWKAWVKRQDDQQAARLLAGVEEWVNPGAMPPTN